MPDKICIERMQLFALSCDIAVGPRSSLGEIPRRNGLLLAVHDKDGAVGWGEVWCNFPPRHAISMAMLIEDVIAPHLLSHEFSDWRDVRPYLEKTLARMVIHTGQLGSFSHCFAGIDTAVADLTARRKQIPLHQLLSPSSMTNQQIPVYASSPSGANLEDDLAEILKANHKSVKLKLGYDEDQDTKTLESFDKASFGQLKLYVDANQAWTLPEAIEAVKRFEPWSLGFIEEPLRADANQLDWCKLAQMSTIAIAAGENIIGAANFETFITNKSLGFVQPDVAKWGGVSGAFGVASLAYENDLHYAFHFMGTALGLAATLHTCAAAYGHGPVELDANVNPLKTDLGDINLTVANGSVKLPQGDGLGFVPDIKALEKFSDVRVDLRT